MYFKTKSKLIYELDNIRTCVNSETSSLHQIATLRLLAGIDYVNPDENDIQGYVRADRFDESLQSENVVIYWSESIKEAFESNGFERITALPSIS